MDMTKRYIYMYNAEGKRQCNGIPLDSTAEKSFGFFVQLMFSFVICFTFAHLSILYESQESHLFITFTKYIYIYIITCG